MVRLLIVGWLLVMMVNYTNNIQQLLLVKLFDNRGQCQPSWLPTFRYWLMAGDYFSQQEFDGESIISSATNTTHSRVAVQRGSGIYHTNHWLLTTKPICVLGQSIEVGLPSSVVVCPLLKVPVQKWLNYYISSSVISCWPLLSIRNLQSIFGGLNQISYSLLVLIP